MGKRGRRIRAVLDSQFAVITTILLVAALVGAGMTYAAYAEQATKVTEKPGSNATYTGEFIHRATVERSNPVFPRGRTLSDRSVYFSRLTPTLDGTFIYRYTASGSGNVTVDGTLTLVIAAVDSGPDDSTVEYWRKTRRLDQKNASLAPGESLELAFSENVTELANESAQLDEAVGNTPGTIETRVVADVETDGRVNGRQVSREQRYELGISPDGGIYRVADPGPITNTTEQTRMVQVAETPGPLRRIGGPGLAVIGFGGLLFLGVSRYQGRIELGESERTYMNYESARSEFDDWITRARLPPEALDGAVVEVESLEGLVDIAIDSDRRVIETGDGEFVVTVEDLVYRYTAPPEPGPASWSPLVSRPGADVTSGDTWGEQSGEAGDDANGETPEAEATSADATGGETED